MVIYHLVCLFGFVQHTILVDIFNGCNRHGGGIAFYIANHLSYSVICSCPNNLELLAISLSLPCGNVGMALLYRPPSSPVSYFDNLSSALENLCIPLFSNFLLIGDCSVNISTPTTLCRQVLDMIS